MQRRNAAATYHYFALLLLGIFLSTVSRRLEPLWVVLPLLVALLHSHLVRPRLDLKVQCTVAPLRAFEGDTLTVQLTVQASTATPPLELWHVLPEGVRCLAGSPRLLLALHPGEAQTFAHQLVCNRRGKYTFGRIYGRVHAGADLQPLLAEYDHRQTCTIYPRLTTLPRDFPPLRTHVSFGNYVSRAAGEGLEFAGIRQYSSGDRLRRVHWRTSLSRQQLYVNEYASERNADVVILLDTLVAFGNAYHNTLDVAVRAAASLAAHYLYHKDRVGLISYGGVSTWVPPALGQWQLYRILDTLLEARPHFSYLAKDLTLIPPRVLPPGALIFVLTTFLDMRIRAALHDLLARAFPLVLLVLSPASALPKPLRHGHAEAITRLWRLETEYRLHEFRRLGVPLFLQESDAPLEALHAAVIRGNVWLRNR